MLSDAEVVRLGEGLAVVRDDVVPAADVLRWQRALARLAGSGRLTPAGVGRERRLDPSIRGDLTSWASDVEDADVASLRSWFVHLGQQVSEAAWLGLRELSLQLACFPGDGAHYARHRDAFRVDPERRLTAILYLNPAWRPEHGGCLRLFGPEGPDDLAPLGGRLVLFLSERLEHEVQPTFAPRYAATAWYRGPGVR